MMLNTKATTNKVNCLFDCVWACEHETQSSFFNRILFVSIGAFARNSLEYYVTAHQWSKCHSNILHEEQKN